MLLREKLASYRLAGLLHPISSQHKMMAMLKAYLDESGIHRGSAVTVLAGYWGTAQQWEELEMSCRAFLENAGIPYFHAVDCWHGHKPFEGLAFNQRIALYQEVINLINDSQIIGVVHGVHVTDYNTILQGTPRQVVGEPYTFCFQQVMFNICDAMARLYPSEKVSLVFEQQREFGHKAYDQFLNLKQELPWKYRDRLQDIGFSDKQETIPLQLADILSYETYREVTRRVVSPDQPERWPFLALYRKEVGGYITGQPELEILKNALVTNPDWASVEEYFESQKHVSNTRSRR